jgi:hypothetical protein
MSPHKKNKLAIINDLLQWFVGVAKRLFQHQV